MKGAENITTAAGRGLLKLARQTIMAHLGKDDPQSPALAQSLAADELAAQRGVFVTLHKHGQLRGCIGNLSSCESIIAGVRNHAINAAFNDQRFPPLSADEVADIDIEVSILTTPQPLNYKDADDLLGKLRVGVDGVILRQGLSNATFLPQVWQQLPEPVDFLSHLCRKAGLAPDAWRSGEPDVLTYQVQYFREETD